MQLNKRLHRHLVNLQMPLLSTILLIHHTDQVTEPVSLILFLLVGIVEAVNILSTDAPDRTAKGANGILHLPHI